MRIANFTHSLTITSSRDLGDPHLAAVEPADHRPHEIVRLRDGHDLAPLVAGFPELRDLLSTSFTRLLVASVRTGAVDESIECELQALAGCTNARRT